MPRTPPFGSGAAPPPGMPGEPRAAGSRRHDVAAETQLVDQSAHVPASGRVALGPDVERQTRQLGGSDQTADAIGCLEHSHAHADLRALERSDESADSAADHDDVRLVRLGCQIIEGSCAVGHPSILPPLRCGLGGMAPAAAEWETGRHDAPHHG